MFDVLTYQKGAGVLRMLERYLGAERFRAGVRHYLEAHRFGNTETADLWDAIEAASGEPVRDVMDSWILQGGFPLVTVDGAPGPTTGGRYHGACARSRSGTRAPTGRAPSARRGRCRSSPGPSATARSASCSAPNPSRSGSGARTPTATVV